MSAHPLTLPLGQHVIVRLPDIGAVPATVVATGDEALTLILPVLDDRVRRLPGAEASVEWTYGLGAQRCTGTVLSSGDRCELLRIRLSGDVEGVARRRWARTAAELPVRVTVIDQPGAGGETSTIDVSAGGLLLHDPWRLRSGVDLRLELVLDPAEEPIHVLAQVVREARLEQTGVRFEDIADEDQLQLGRYVAELERERLELALSTDF